MSTIGTPYMLQTESMLAEKILSISSREYGNTLILSVNGADKLLAEYRRNR